MSSRWMIRVLGVAGLAAHSSGAYAAVPLASYNIAPNSVSVAGISSGGAMAVQLQVAYSKSFHGAAIFAGLTYYCAQGNARGGPCTTASGGAPVSTYVNYTLNQAAAGTIDPVSNIAGKPIYMFSGTLDTTVPQTTMDYLYLYYGNFTAAGNIAYNDTTPARHAWITPDASHACGYNGSPYMNDCGFDPEQAFLTQTYGPLNPRNNSGVPAGAFVQFNQDAFCAGGKCSAIGMDSTAWTYVPNTCAAGQACRIVVALHGCAMSQSSIGTAFVEDSGLNEWADTNNIIVLYPQTKISVKPRNNNGCWDWWGYTNANYALKSGPQMQAIMAAVNRLTGGMLNP